MDNKRISEIVEEEMIKQDANRYRDMRKTLTIPKSIADELGETTLLDFVDEIKSYEDLSYKLFDYVKQFESDMKDNWYEIFLAYLNPLTRDLVKVVEG